MPALSMPEAYADAHRTVRLWQENGLGPAAIGGELGCARAWHFIIERVVTELLLEGVVDDQLVLPLRHAA